MKRRWANPTPATWWAIAISVIATVATSVYLAVVYPALPMGVPVRYVMGLPLIYQLKTPIMVALPAIVQVGLLTVFGALMLLLLYRAQPGHSAHHDVEGDGERMRRAAEGIALLGAVWIAVQAFGAVRLIALWRGGFGGYGRAYSFTMLAAIIASIVIAARTMSHVGRERRKVAPPIDPAVWRLRQLYFNPGDPALFVPTRTGGGWTLNFGRPLAILIMAVTLIFGIGGPYVLAVYVLRGFGD